MKTITPNHRPKAPELIKHKLVELNDKHTARIKELYDYFNGDCTIVEIGTEGTDVIDDKVTIILSNYRMRMTIYKMNLITLDLYQYSLNKLIKLDI